MPNRFDSELRLELYQTVREIDSELLKCGKTAQTVTLDCGHVLVGVTATPLHCGDLVRCPKCT